MQKFGFNNKPRLKEFKWINFNRRVNAKKKIPIAKPVFLDSLKNRSMYLINIQVLENKFFFFQIGFPVILGKV